MQNVQILDGVLVMLVVTRFSVVAVKNVCGILDYGTLEYAVS